VDVQTVTGVLPGQDTLIASWRALAAVSPGAEVIASPLAVAAVFPQWAVLNNAAANVAGEEPLVAADLPEPDRPTGIEGWALVRDGLAGAWSCIHGWDCGIYAVGTVPEWRRRGFGRALVEHVLADARRRGVRTTTLQSTPMGQPLYESLGYVAAGRYEEWVSR
jgi:GNAT superfamily N-acetyltransferase